MSVPFALVLAAFAQTAEAQRPPVVSVTGADFMHDQTNALGIVPTTATRAIPHVPGTSCYRWIIGVKPQPAGIRIREVFTLPSFASNGGTLDGTVVALDAKSATTDINETLEDVELTNSWCVSEGDPEGPHVSSVYADDRLLQTFRFAVIKRTY